MKCNCSLMNGVLAVIILIVAIWPGLIGATASMWVTIVAAALVLIHSIMHKHTKIGNR